MPYKEGGGGKTQPYNINNGEYIRNPQCEEDEENLVMIKIFGIDTKKQISYPVFGIHDEEYCELIIKYCLNTNKPLLEKDKITRYLLIKRENDDKSKILNDLGYSLRNWEELNEQIIAGTNFNKKRLSRFQTSAFTFKAETKILNKSTKKYYYCTTIWAVELNFNVRFVTLIPEVYQDEKN